MNGTDPWVNDEKVGADPNVALVMVVVASVLVPVTARVPCDTKLDVAVNTDPVALPNSKLVSLAIVANILVDVALTAVKLVVLAVTRLLVVAEKLLDVALVLAMLVSVAVPVAVIFVPVALPKSRPVN